MELTRIVDKATNMVSNNPAQSDLVVPYSSTTFASPLPSVSVQTDHHKHQVIGIDILPDDVLLETLAFYVADPFELGGKKEIHAWQSLVHVCWRWRNLVFGSSRRLNLRLCCTPQTPAKDRLDIWPAFPLIVVDTGDSTGTDNVVAALEQSNRVHRVTLNLAGCKSEKVLAPMQVPFPELRYLYLLSRDKTAPVFPDSFLGGSAPRLEYFSLSGISLIPFLGLPTKLFLSATQLSTLRLDDIPHSGYISSMVAALSALSSLKLLRLEFRSPQSLPEWESQSILPPNRSVLPALCTFVFNGIIEYLKELTARIDTPQLDGMFITFSNQINFDCPQLAQFINRTPELRALNEAHVEFSYRSAYVRLQHRTSNSCFGNFRIKISCEKLDCQVSCMAQVSLPPTVEYLYIEPEPYCLPSYNHIEKTLWLQLFHPLTAVKYLYLSREFAAGIAAALYEGRMTDVFPSLQNIFVEREVTTPKPFHENIEHFVAARQLRISNHTISTFVWNKDSNLVSQ